ncbi:hypothetical protein V6N13_134888 [Hibiscus sabdariffa]
MGFLGWRSAALCLILLEVLFSLQVECFPGLFDRISGLPGQPQVEFQQYSGYVTVDEKKQRALFYYLQKLKLKQIQLPSLLSYGSTEGLDALHLGLEPFPRMDRLGLVGKCWSRTNIAGLEQSHCFAEANMLYLESPIGVGFSFSADDSSYEDVNDKTTGIEASSLQGKAMLLGNPVLEFATDFNSRAEFFWSHGLIPDSTYKLFTTSCNYSRYVGEYYRGNVSPICSRVMSQVSTETSRFVDKYDVTLDVCISSVFSQSKILTPQVSLPKQQVGETIDVCVEDETVNYLNRQDVQKALHARLVGVLDYELLDIEIPTITIVGRLLKAGIPVMVYSGDQDSVIPLTGSRTLVNQLAKELGLRTTVAYRVWFAGQQVGGWTQVYGNILSFATVRGASHEAPFSQPERSLVLFKAFIEGQPLPEAF